MMTEFFERLDSNYEGFSQCRLVSCFTFDSNWSTWEIHPHGNEIVIHLDGQATMVLETEAGKSRFTLNNPGSCVVIPVNTWHTAETLSQARMHFITPGQGTRNKAI